MKLETSLDKLRKGVVPKGIAYFSISLFSFVFYFAPAGQVIAQDLREDDRRQTQIDQMMETSPEATLAYRLQKLKDKVVFELPEKIAEREDAQGVFEAIMTFIFTKKGILEDDELVELTEIKESIADAYDDAKQGFDATGQLIEQQVADEKMPKVALERHLTAQEQVTTQYNQMQTYIEQLANAQGKDAQHNALNTLTDFLNQQQFKKSHSAEDPNRMPFGTPSADVREPITDERDLQAMLGINPNEKYLQLASAKANPALIINAMAALGTPTPEDLLPTIDAPFTQDIQDLAASLNNNPTEIYAWVHNNIRFIPSYGSIQGAQMTLETKSGNAMDTASLLIALLRSSGIPARYAYGTVDIPADQVMNWVGGVEVPEAALNLMGQGGIPSLGLRQGGQITHIRLEHTWVEAWVDFEPSRGVNNQTGDTWIPLDGSFKQYEFIVGLDVENNVEFDAELLIDEAFSNAVIDQTEGFIQNINQDAVNDRLSQYQLEISDYLNAQSSQIKVDSVLGIKRNNIIPIGPLPAGLPYDHIVTQEGFSVTPDNLRYRFKYTLSTQVNGYPSNILIEFNEPTVSIAGKKITLSFSPSTDDDYDLIKGYLPAPDPITGDIDETVLPDKLPGYLINLDAELILDGNLIDSGYSGNMGSELYETLQLWSPQNNWQSPAINYPIVGEYRAIALNLQGVSASNILEISQDVDTTKTKLEMADETELSSLSKQDIFGDLLIGVILDYFAMNDVQNEIASRDSNILSFRAPSYGLFGTNLTPEYWFGLPRSVVLGGFSMDVDALAYQIVSKNNNDASRASYVQSIGAIGSILEHQIPEQMLLSDMVQSFSISAVKAIAIAEEAGQKIFIIDQSNLNSALNSINLSQATETEIRNSVLAGRIVTTHESQVVVNGWVGEGYIILDPDSGAGAYKIAGGTNGSATTTEDQLDVFLDVMTLIGESNDAYWLRMLEEVGHTIIHGPRSFGLLGGMALTLKGIGYALEDLALSVTQDIVIQEYLIRAANGFKAAGHTLSFVDTSASGVSTTPTALMATSIILNTMVAPYLVGVDWNLLVSQ